MSNQPNPKTNINHFGVEYCYQGAFEGAQLETVKTNWLNAGHKVLMQPKGSNHLYVTRFKTRNW
ncbi:hypothetical protein I5M32_11280 [Pedobacter sp. SD-b]|uniref:Uncharacterized protein n=1 Tax=Pedobacter segetis TaxID=2793069 RepID=A0ABS1BKX1_9SPHI|nr:hypothetical protein [Pedobacter segetis]MBK0383539.1 hypothetical protein [Pedobacter segetis]